MGNRRIAILAEGRFGPLESKTANQTIRYLAREVVGVIDRRHAGKTAEMILGYGGSIPVVDDLPAALAFGPDTLLIGIAPKGGRLPEEWRPIVREAIIHGLTVVSGLHTILSEDAEFRRLAQDHRSRLVDLRRVSADYEVIAGGSWKHRSAKTILTVGTDSNVGKMTASLELHREFQRRGLASDFIATGQTGILISGRGVAIDAVISDYVSGAIELEIDRSEAKGSTFIHVEGQGSLTHQGYSGVTLGLMHGTMPDAMVMVHHAGRHADDYGFGIDDLPGLIALHEHVLRPFKISRVVGIALNAVLMNRRDAEDARRVLENSTGLPVVDVLTPDISRLADAVLASLARAGVAGTKSD